MDKLHSTMNTYVKSMSKRKEGDDKEKMLPVDVLAQAMIAHGEEFESDSLFGTCLISAFPLPLRLPYIHIHTPRTRTQSHIHTLSYPPTSALTPPVSACHVLQSGAD